MFDECCADTDASHSNGPDWARYLREAARISPVPISASGIEGSGWAWAGGTVVAVKWEGAWAAEEIGIISCEEGLGCWG